MEPGEKTSFPSWGELGEKAPSPPGNIGSDVVSRTKIKEENPPAEDAEKPKGAPGRHPGRDGVCRWRVEIKRAFCRQHQALENQLVPAAGPVRVQGASCCEHGKEQGAAVVGRELHDQQAAPRVGEGGGSSSSGLKAKASQRTCAVVVAAAVAEEEEGGGGAFLCKECGKRFAWMSSLNIHKRTHTGEKPFRCKTCGQRFSQKPNLLCHQRNHTGERPFKCSRCERSFRQKQHLLKHQRTHLRAKPPRPHSCPDCQRSFSNQAVLRLHFRAHAHHQQLVFRELKAAYKETVARQREEARAGLSCWGARPKGRRRGVKKFICSECGKGFTWWSSLSIHQRIHTGEKPFPCSQCGKSFTQKPNLLRHMRYHSGERPHACAECGKGFTQKQHLLKHQRTHQAEKGFQCHACGQSFPTKGALTGHQKSGHGGADVLGTGMSGEKGCLSLGQAEGLVEPLTASNQDVFPPPDLWSPQSEVDGQPVLIVAPGTRPLALSQTKKGVFWKPDIPKPPAPELKYICSECGKGFVSWSALTIHKRIHTGERPYQCEECGKCFSQKQNLLRHQRYHTGEKPYPCAECGKCFVQKHHLSKHQRIHRKAGAPQSPAPAAEAGLL